MKIIENKSNTDFQIKIGDKYVTIASLVPFIYSKHLNKYSLYFYYYGEEFYKGKYPCHYFNGNVSITVWRGEHEFWYDFIERVNKIVTKKLYVIGSSILEEIRYVEE